MGIIHIDFQSDTACIIPMWPLSLDSLLIKLMCCRQQQDTDQTNILTEKQPTHNQYAIQVTTLGLNIKGSPNARGR